MSNCNSLSCGRNRGTCRTWGCGCTTDATPACNPCAPWGRSGGTGSTGCIGCGCSSCTWQGCGSCSTCGNSCGTCDSCTSSCTCGTSCETWNGCTASGATLTPRFVSIGRTFQKRITQTLCITDLPDYVETPLTLTCVTVCGQATWEQISECRNQLLRVMVPVVVQIRDCGGRCITGHATVTLTIPLCSSCRACDLWRSQLYVAPCIRLAAQVTANEDGCFDATLEVQAEVYRFQLQPGTL